MSRRFFSGKTLRAAILSAASHYDIDPDELVYQPVEKKQGRLRTTGKVVISVDPQSPSQPAAEPADEPPAAAGGGGEPSPEPELSGSDDDEDEGPDEDEDLDGDEDDGEDADDEDADEDADDEDDDDEDDDDEDDDDEDAGDEDDDEDDDEDADDEDADEDDDEDDVDEDEEGDDQVAWFDGGEEPDSEDPYALEDDVDGNRAEGPPPHLQSHRRPEPVVRGGRGGGRKPAGRGRKPADRSRGGRARGGRAEGAPEGNRAQGGRPKGGRPKGGRPKGGRPPGGPPPAGRGKPSRAAKSSGRGSRPSKGGAGLVDLPPEPRPLAERLDPADGDLATAAKKAVELIAELAGIEVEAQVFQGDDRLEIDLTSDHGELLTAEDGELLVAIEHLLPRAMRGFGGETAAVRVDCEHFQEIREEKLRSFAQQVANEVRKSGRSRSLTPLSPSDRRIVHMAIATEPGVESESEGRGFLKRIRVSAS